MSKFTVRHICLSPQQSKTAGTIILTVPVMDGIYIAQYIALASSPILLLVFYIYWNDNRLFQLPPSALYFSPKRHTAVDVHAEAKRLATSPPIDDTEKIPPKTGRRYIVVGGVSCYNYEQRNTCLFDRLFFFS